MKDSLTAFNSQTWANGRHLVRCAKVVYETSDVTTFCFMAAQPTIFFFKPGQFVTLELEIDGQQAMRSYTISSSPATPYNFNITVKRAPGGVVSNWLHDNLREGHEIAVHGPAGGFNCIDFPATKALMLSGGVGITPVISMARWWFDTNADIDINFVYSVRTPRDIIFRQHLELMAARLSNFSLSIVSERTESGDSWHGYKGHLTEAMLRLIAPDFLDREIYCCGPTPYMRAVKAILEKTGYPMKNYHEESFGETPAKISSQVSAQIDIARVEESALPSGEQVSIHFSSSEKIAFVEPNCTIHEAATKLGIFLPKACGVGVCGTCKVKKISGEIVMNHNGGIEDEEIAAGLILSCCSTAKGDVVLAC
jgi:ferredoxin-NADP reductase